MLFSSSSSSADVLAVKTKSVFTLTLSVLIITVAFGNTVIPSIHKIIRATIAPPISNVRFRNLLKFGILGVFSPFVPLALEVFLASGFIAPAASTSLSSSIVSSSLLASFAPTAVAAASSPTVLALSTFGSSSTGSSSRSSNLSVSFSSSARSSEGTFGSLGIAGFDCSVLATCNLTAPASGKSPASLVMSTSCFLFASLLFLRSFIFTILCNTAARFGNTSATILCLLLTTLSIIPVISSSTSI